MHNFVTTKFCHQTRPTGFAVPISLGQDFVKARGPVVINILFPIPPLKLKKTNSGMNLTAEFECYTLFCVDISFIILSMEVTKCFYI